MEQTKLSKQQKKIIKALGKKAKKERGMTSRDLSHLIANDTIPKYYWGKYKRLSNTKRASISRSIKRLTKRKLVYRKTSHYSDVLESRIKCNVLFVTDEGKKVYNKLERVNKKIKREKS